MTDWFFDEYHDKADSQSPAFKRAQETLVRIVENLILTLDAALEGRLLPRAAYAAGLRLLLPAEAATRRLILVMACALNVAAPARRPMSGFGASGAWRWVKGGRLVWATIDGERREVLVKPGQRLPVGAVLDDGRVIARRLWRFRLFDPTERFVSLRKAGLAPRNIARISFYGPDGYVTYPPLPEPEPPRGPVAARGDEVDATAIGRRLGALQRALANLPKEARRMARLMARRDHDRDCINNAGQASATAGRCLSGGLREVLRRGDAPGATDRRVKLYSQREIQPLLRFADRLARCAEQDRQIRLEAGAPDASRPNTS